MSSCVTGDTNRTDSDWTAGVVGSFDTTWTPRGDERHHNEAMCARRKNNKTHRTAVRTAPPRVLVGARNHSSTVAMNMHRCVPMIQNVSLQGWHTTDVDKHCAEVFDSCETTHAAPVNSVSAHRDTVQIKEKVVRGPLPDRRASAAHRSSKTEAAANEAWTGRTRRSPYSGGACCSDGCIGDGKDGKKDHASSRRHDKDCCAPASCMTWVGFTVWARRPCN